MSTTKKWQQKNDKIESQRCIVCGNNLPKDPARTVNLCPVCEARISAERFGAE
jgi:rubrerythrin